MKEFKVCLLWHNLNSNNYGVGALAIANISLLLKAADAVGVAVEIETVGTPNVGGLKIKEYVESRFGIEVSHRDFSLRDLVTRLLRFDFSGISQFGKYDLCLDIGEGDSFTDIYGVKRFFAIVLPKLFSVLKGVRLVLAPQTVGPFKSRLVRMVANWLLKKHSAIFVRDRKSQDYLDSCGITGECVSDVAFVLPYDAHEKKPGSVGVNVSGLLWNGGYTGKNQFGLKIDYKQAVIELVKAFRDRGKEVFLVGHVIADQIPVEDDYRASVAVKEIFANDDGVILAPKFTSPIEAKSFISGLEFFTGSRMHATIGALSSGVVTVPIAYSRKFSGVFGSIGYDYTLDAYALSTEDLVRNLLDLYDHSFLKMNDAMLSAVPKARAELDRYSEFLKELLKDAVH